MAIILFSNYTPRGSADFAPSEKMQDGKVIASPCGKCLMTDMSIPAFSKKESYCLTRNTSQYILVLNSFCAEHLAGFLFYNISNYYPSARRGQKYNFGFVKVS